MIVNCYRCGRSVDEEEVEVRLFDGGNRIMCEDREDCIDWIRNDYPEEIQDTPSLDPPWWAYK